jgi:Holliday junction resolvasome RuvABC endonuclease subunit
MKRTIAIDPGSTKTGWAFRGEDGKIISGVAKAPAKKPRAERIALINEEIKGMLREPGISDLREGNKIFTDMVIEVASNKTYARNRGSSGAKNLQSVYVLGMAAGVIIHTARGQGLEVHERTDQEWIGKRKKKLRQQQAIWILKESGIIVPDEKKKTISHPIKVMGKIPEVTILKDDNEADAICLLYWYEGGRK